jgi:2-oxoglutarate ferredoxin oxidoreductase subunit delta
MGGSPTASAKGRNKDRSVRLWRRPLDFDEHAAPRATIHLIDLRCKGCGLCVEYCPEKVLALSDRFNQKGYHPPCVAAPEACVGCGFCEEVCPEFAIFCEVQEDRSGP